jgi:MFS family permease
MPEPTTRSGPLADLTRAGGLRLTEPWFAPFALLNGAALGLTPILLPVAASRDGVGHVGLVMGAFNLGAFAAPLTGTVADRYRARRGVTVLCAPARAARSSCPGLPRSACGTA